MEGFSLKHQCMQYTLQYFLNPQINKYGHRKCTINISKFPKDFPDFIRAKKFIGVKNAAEDRLVNYLRIMDFGALTESFHHP